MSGWAFFFVLIGVVYAAHVMLDALERIDDPHR